MRFGTPRECACVGSRSRSKTCSRPWREPLRVCVGDGGLFGGRTGPGCRRAMLDLSMMRCSPVIRLVLRIGGGLLVAAAIDLALTMPAPASGERLGNSGGGGPLEAVNLQCGAVSPRQPWIDRQSRQTPWLGERPGFR